MGKLNVSDPNLTSAIQEITKFPQEPVKVKCTSKGVYYYSGSDQTEYSEGIIPYATIRKKLREMKD